MASKPTRIHYRCWYCNRGYAAEPARVGEVRACACGQRLRVPRRSGGSSRARTAVDWLVEGLVYGTGGAALGFGLAVGVAGQFLVVPVPGARRTLIAGLTVAGFLAGLFGGEPAVNWLGRTLRDRADR